MSRVRVPFTGDSFTWDYEKFFTLFTIYMVSALTFAVAAIIYHIFHMVVQL